METFLGLQPVLSILNFVTRTYFQIACFPGYLTNNTWFFPNTGLSSSINWGRRLLTEEADIVTAHRTYVMTPI